MIWIGTSGWVYRHWVGPFYPASLPQRDWLPYYARHFPTVEINRSFYRLPGRATFVSWAQQTAFHEGFRFAVKASRYITHLRKLRDSDAAVRRLMEAALGLGPSLGPVLYQLPPHWHANPERLARFVQLLPPTPPAAFEFRDRSWFHPEVLRVLEDAGCALTVAIGGGCPTPDDVPPTGSFRYVRVHGGAWGIGLSDDELRSLAAGLLAMGDLEAFVYFNNDPEGHAIRDAERLRALLEAAGAALAR